MISNFRKAAAFGVAASLALSVAACAMPGQTSAENSANVGDEQPLMQDILNSENMTTTDTGTTTITPSTETVELADSTIHYQEPVIVDNTSYTITGIERARGTGGEDALCLVIEAVSVNGEDEVSDDLREDLTDNVGLVGPDGAVQPVTLEAGHVGADGVNNLAQVTMHVGFDYDGTDGTYLFALMEDDTSNTFVFEVSEGGSKVTVPTADGTQELELGEAVE